jgi:hypothetical protein
VSHHTRKRENARGAYVRGVLYPPEPWENNVLYIAKKKKKKKPVRKRERERIGERKRDKGKTNLSVTLTWSKTGRELS